MRGTPLINRAASPLSQAEGSANGEKANRQQEHRKRYEVFFMKQNRTPAARRARMGALSGGIGIAVNTLLAAAKIALGAVTGALSVLADGMNNLTDCGSNVVSLIGLKMSEKPADK